MHPQSYNAGWKAVPLATLLFGAMGLQVDSDGVVQLHLQGHPLCTSLPNRDRSAPATMGTTQACLFLRKAISETRGDLHRRLLEKLCQATKIRARIQQLPLLSIRNWTSLHPMIRSIRSRPFTPLMQVKRENYRRVLRNDRHQPAAHEGQT